LEVVEKLMDQHRELLRQLEALCNRLADIVEKRLK